MRPFKCLVGSHDWPEWYDTGGRASAWQFTRQCRRCKKWQCRVWIGLVR